MCGGGGLDDIPRLPLARLARRESGGGKLRIPNALLRLDHELKEGDAARWGDASCRVAGNFYALEQREEGTVLLRAGRADLNFSVGSHLTVRSPLCI